MKKIVFLSLFISSVALAAQTSSFSSLEGNWSGKITKNFKKSDAGGKPTPGATGAPATITLKATPTGLKGTSVTGGDSEEWVIEGDAYTWTDAEMSVSAKATGKLPVWVQTELSGSGAGKTFAFEFASCKLNKTQKPCEVKTNIPEGLDKGYWIFKVDGNKLTTSVLYQYPSGGTRHLSEELTK